MKTSFNDQEVETYSPTLQSSWNEVSKPSPKKQEKPHTKDQRKG